jgi:hypothetical protein
MAAKAPAKPTIPPYLAAKNPLNDTLPSGLAADPVYLAFARGAGYSFNNAAEQLLSQVAAARAAYNTGAARLPEQLKEALQGTNNAAADRGVFSSGERLVNVSRDRQANQNAYADLASTRSTAISNAQSQLQSAISQIARDRADAIGALQDRNTQRANQEKYIAAVRGANSGGGGGGSVSLTLPSLPAPGPAQPPGRAGGNAQGPNAGQTVNQYLADSATAQHVYRLAAPQQADWMKFMQAAYPGADFAPLLQNINRINQNYSVGVGGSKVS